jgi:hypothetical protein
VIPQNGKELSEWSSLIFELWPIIHQGIYKRWGNAIKLLEEIKLKLYASDDQASEEDLIDLILLGTDIIHSSYDYEIDLLNWIKEIDTSPKVVTLLDTTTNEISDIHEIHNSRWTNQTRKFREEIDAGLSKSKLKVTFKPNFDGPFEPDHLVDLFKNILFKEFCKTLKSEFLGPISELINLVCKGYNILRVTSLLSLEYKKVISPNKILKLVGYLERENIIHQL